MLPELFGAGRQRHIWGIWCGFGDPSGIDDPETCRAAPTSAEVTPVIDGECFRGVILCTYIIEVPSMIRQHGKVSASCPSQPYCISVKSLNKISVMCAYALPYLQLPSKGNLEAVLHAHKCRSRGSSHANNDSYLPRQPLLVRFALT